MIYVVFFARRRQSNIGLKDKINLIPFQNKIIFFRNTVAYDLRAQYGFYSDLIGNVILFLPFVFAIHWLSDKQFSNWFLLTLIVFSSLSIEILQYVLNIGVADIDDVILNTTGGVLGLLVFHFLNFKTIND